MYYLPYVWGRLSAANAQDLYELLYNAENESEGADHDRTPVELAYDNRDTLFGDAELRFYVSAVMPHQMSRYDVFGETLNGRLLYPLELAREHNHLVRDTSAFRSDTEWTAPLPTNEKWDLLVGSDERLGSISTGWYFHQTFAERDNDDADADDPRIEALVAVLSGDTISVETLLAEYVDRIVNDQTDDEIEGFPSFRVAGQFAQLCALATDELDLLTTDDEEKEPITREPTYGEYTMDVPEEMLATDGGNPAATKLESFIEDTPALTHDEDAPLNDQRRGAFLLGALVGEIGSYQEYDQDRSTTLVDQFPVKSITGSRIKKVTQETIAKTLTYTRQEKKQGRSYPGTKADHIVERLRETILRPDPTSGNSAPTTSASTTRWA
ncbi:MAG: type I-B CRISPR-associated protein Cas8b/Csh1 [Halapricum sp.]